MSLEKNKRSKPINIPISNKKKFNLNNMLYDTYEYKSPINVNNKNTEEQHIEKFLYMSDNFNPNTPSKSPPISSSFKRRYLDKVAKKIIQN